MKGMMLYDWRNSIKNEKRGSKKMEVVYNVKYKFKTKENKSNEELKDIFNKKLLNIIIALENKELLLKNS